MTAREAGDNDRGALRPVEVLGITLALVLFVLLRLPLFREPGLRLGWNSDAAIFGLMARAIAAGEELPIFFWGQSYMGPLTSYLAAIAGTIIGTAGPFALRLVAAVEVLGGLLLFCAGLRQGFGRTAAVVAALWLAAGPAFLFHFTVAPIGAEQILLLGGALFLLAVRTGLQRWQHWFAFGLLSGVGWWINQGVFFVIAAGIVVWITGPAPWTKIAGALRPGSRLLLEPGRLEWRPIDRGTRVTLLALQAVLLIWLLLGIIRSFTPVVPAPFLFHPVGEPATVLLVVHLALELAFGTCLRRALTHWILEGRQPVAAATLGFFIGYLPVIAGGLLGLYPRTYGFSAPLISVDGIPGRLINLVADWWRLVGGASSIAGIVAASIITIALGGAVLRKQSANTPRAIGLMVVAFCALFYLLSWRAHPGSMRYVIVALPVLYACAAAEMLRWRRPVAVAAVLAVATALTWDRFAQVREVTAARSEQYDGFAGGFDPQPVLRTIEDRGYRVCYADYWIAYKLEWVSEQRVLFIPYRSFDRNRPRSRSLTAANVPKCYVANDGSVMPFVSVAATTPRRVLPSASSGSRSP